MNKRIVLPVLSSLLLCLSDAQAQTPLDIGGYVLTQANSAQTFTLPAGTLIPAGGYVIVGRTADQAAFETAWGVTLGEDVVYVNSEGKVPQINGAETYTLSDASSTVVDGPTPSTLDPVSSSVQRTALGSVASDAASWTKVAMASATPGTGATGDGTAGLRISEYSDATDFANEFVELFYDIPVIPPSNMPPSIAIVPNDTSLSVAVGNEISFAITGSEIPNDAADQITLRATGLPAGASFPEVSGTSVLTNVFSWTPAATGTTVVSFFAGDKDGTNQIDVTIQAYEQQPVGTYRAVICGISDYDGTINDLTYCDDDAQDLYDLLLTGSNWEAGNVQLLLNNQATEGNIQAAIAAMGAASQPGDVNLFFFSGHGGDDMPDTDGDEGGDGYDEYLCPYMIMDTEITDDELSDWLDALPTDNIIVLLDTCHSGGHLKAPTSLTPKGISRTDAVVTDRSNGFVDDLRKKGVKDVDDLTSPYISTAADDDEYSYEDPEIGHGVYTLFLLDAITNSVASDTSGDGWVSGEESFTYLYPKVVAYESTQHPQEYDGWNGLANIVGWEPLVDQPPRITLDPAGTNKTVVFDNPLSFTVTATDSDGLAVSLTASDLPTGATAPEANGTGTASTTFSWTPGEAQVGTYHVTFSATDDDGTTVLGVKIAVRDGSMAADLFISEYIEGSSNNKAVEIFNGTGAAVDLGTAGYVLRIYSNGSTTPTTITLAGTVADGDVFVVAKNDANATILALADQTSGSLTHNGNDVVALAKNDANIDVVGTIGSDVVFAADVTKVRKSTVVEGTTTYDPLEWDDYAADTTDYLGSHEFGAAEPSAPSFAAIPPQSASVGVLFSLDVSAYDSGNPVPALSLVSSTADAGDYSFAGSTLSFTPSVAGEFEFVFQASNELGTAMATATVTAVAGPVELLAPVIQAASAIDATQFNANWLASAGATGYILDVDTNGTFYAGGSTKATLVSENIQSWTDHAGYGTWTQSIPAGTVNMTECIVAPAAAASGIGSTGRVQLRASTGILELPALNTVGTVTMNIAAGGADRSAKLQKYNGSTWDDLTTWTGIGIEGAAFTFDVNDSGASVQLRIASPSSAIYVHDIVVTSYGGGGGGSTFVPGYENLDVGDVVTHTVTGLTEGVTYYYRAKAYNALSNSPYSAVTSVVTQASSGEQPDIAAFEVPAGAAAAATLTTSAVGKTYKLQFTTDLTTQPEPFWTDADSEHGTGTELLLEDTDLADTARYYRVVVQ
ncbi:MAG: hypothetical protein EOL90_06275 [Spartobacteria bacterium]|nr:hypothetical protein [Spartobacteria bacterium]